MTFEANADSKKCVLVLGMHRSGTSAFTRLISLMGADLPSTLMGGASEHLASNAKGHWESEVVVRFNDKVLAAAGNSWRSPELVGAEWFESVQFSELRAEALTLLESEFGSSRTFVLKDPRICKLIPFWIRVLKEFGAEPIIVNVFRNNLEVAKSLEARSGFDLQLGNLLWLRYVLEVEMQTRAFSRMHFSYDQLLEDWQQVTQKIQQESGILWPEMSASRKREISNYISVSDRHHRELRKMRTRDDLAAWSETALQIHQKWAGAGEERTDYPLLDSVRESLDTAVKQFIGPVLVAFDKTIEADKLQKLRQRQASAISINEAKLLEQERLLSEFVLAEGLIQPADLEEIELDEETRYDRILSKLKYNLLQKAVQDREVGERFDRDLQLYKKQVAELQKKNEKLTENVQHFEDLSISRHLALEETRAERAQLIEATRLELAALKNQRDEAAEQLAAAVAVRDDATGKLLTVSAKLEIVSNEAAELRASSALQISALEKRLKKTAAKFEEQGVARRKEFAEKLIELEDRVGAALKKERARNIEKKKLEKRISDLQQRNDDLRNELSKIRENRRSRIVELKGKISVLERDINVLRKSEDGHLLLRKAAERDVQDLEDKLHQSLCHTHQLIVEHKVKVGLFSKGAGRKNAATLAADTFVIRNTPLFNESFYLGKYPDVAQSGLDAAVHYAVHGGAEGRAASEAFDGGKYLRRYRDVAAAGINPLVHYITRGKREGRKIEPIAAGDVVAKGNRTSAISDAETSEEDHRPASALAVRPPNVEIDDEYQEEDNASNGLTLPLSKLDHASVASWDNLFADLAKEALKTDHERKHCTSDVLCLGVETTGRWSNLSKDAQAAIGIFGDLCRKRAVETGTYCMERVVRTSLAQDQIVITHAWFDSERELCLLVASQADQVLSIQVLQATASGDATSCFSDTLMPQKTLRAQARLADPHEPLLLLIWNADSELIDSVILPFPSLLRGGTHHAELLERLAKQDWIREFEAYSTFLLGKLIAPDRVNAVTRIEIESEGALGSEQAYREDFGEWLARRFGIRVVNNDFHVGSRSDNLSANLALTPVDAGRSLVLPAGAVPTLRLLTLSAAEIDDCRALVTLVRDTNSDRLKRALYHPVLECDDIGISRFFSPIIKRSASDTGEAIPVWLQHTTAAPQDARAYFPAPRKQLEAPLLSVSENDLPITAVIQCSTSSRRLHTLLMSLAAQVPVREMDIILLGAPDDFSLDKERWPSGFRIATKRAINGRNFIASLQEARHDWICILRDDVILHDVSSLNRLLALWAHHTIGSIGCSIVSEIGQPADDDKVSLAGSWVPTQVGKSGFTLSLADISNEEMPTLISVAANRTKCMLLKKDAFVDALPFLTTEDAMQDLALGRALRRAGYCNVATGTIVVSDFCESNDPTEHVAVPMDEFDAVMSMRRF